MPTSKTLTINPAIPPDVPIILELIPAGIAEYERLSHEVVATSKNVAS